MTNPSTPSNDGINLGLSAEEVLSTTRSVRRRLDFDRPVPPELLTACVRLALQAPAGSNRWATQFVIVTDPDQRHALAEVYRKGYEVYRTTSGYIGALDKGTAELNAIQQRTATSADYLAEHLDRAPALVVACAMGRADSSPPIATASLFGSVLPAVWSFMLAARNRGLGTSWTTVLLFHEQEAAKILDIPIDKVSIAALTPVAFTKGSDFRPASRPEPEEVIHWNRW